MKALKYLGLVLVTLLVTACGGHGFEGEYVVNPGKDPFTNAPINGGTVVIGSDYIEKNGARTKMQKIFKRSSGGKEYLVFVTDQGEEAWTITDKDTLVLEAGFLSVRFVRKK